MTETTIASRTKEGFVYRNRMTGKYLCCKSYEGFAGWEETSRLSRAAVLREFPGKVNHADYIPMPALEIREVTILED